MCDIKGFKNYKITKDGEIINKKTKLVLKPSVSKDGYQQLILSKDGKPYTKRIHFIMFETYGNPKLVEKWNSYGGDKRIFHKDGNKLNNKIDNLIPHYAETVRVPDKVYVDGAYIKILRKDTIYHKIETEEEELDRLAEELDKLVASGGVFA